MLQLSLHAQVIQSTGTLEELGKVRIEELTDEQIRKLVAEADRLQLQDAAIEQMALQRGMSPVEIAKLKNRMQAIRKAMNSRYNTELQKNTINESGRQDSIGVIEQRPSTDPGNPFTSLMARNFGAGIFDNPRISFEPNLRIPTPKNYQLAADDELQIDVSGYSEANYKLKVSPEGIIRIPSAGPVFVNGLSIEQAKKLITQTLANTIYADIKNNNTFVEVSLGAIRSIKVTIIGEAISPGTYTLPSLATAYNALYACGGPGTNGSFRNIQVIRNNAPVATIDVYKYLVSGDKKSDIRLMDQDIIKINPYNVRIELKGEVKKPGLYDVAEQETLEEIINYAGGFTDNAYTARIQVFENTSRERKVTTISEDQLATRTPHRGDTYLIGKILNRFTNRTSISGAVYRPGEYELKDSMTLMQLISEADGLREDAFTTRGLIHRLKEDLSPEIISFDIEKIMKSHEKDVVLKREDRITIYSKFDLKEGYYVTIEGEVPNPGTFLYEAGITVQDLILLAGGLKESASVKRIEVSRRVKNADSLSANTKTAIIYQYNITSDLRDSAASAKLSLQPFDEVSIHPAPGYFVQKNVVIEGEVMYAGKYTLQAKNDRISDLVKRAGGLTTEAYLAGAVLVRTRNLSKTEKSNAQQGLGNLVKQNLLAGTPAVLVQGEIENVVQKNSDQVGIKLERILSAPHSNYDLLLNDGDTVRIPRQLQTVRINGEILYPTLVRYDKRMKFKDYISGAGGFSDRSSRKRSYIVYANGSVTATKSFLFFKNYPSVKPGAEIYIPVKRERERLRTGEIVTVGATIVSMLAILYNVFK